MLVMRRRAGESFRIGADVQVEILELTPTRVKIGIVAPPETAIVRGEVALTREANLSAAQTHPAQAIAWLTQRANAGSLELRPNRESQEIDGEYPPVLTVNTSRNPRQKY